MTKLLSLDDEAMEKIWESVQHILFHHQELLDNRYLDQIIICTIYANYMAYKHSLFAKYSEIKFKTMIEKF